MPFLPPVDVPNLDIARQSVILDTRVSTVTDSKLGNFAILEPGAPYPKTTLSVADYAAYGSLLLMRQSATEDPTKMARVFASLPATQDVDNYDISFSGESDSCPVFTRRYIELRDTYTKRADLSTFTGLYRIKLTAAGANYSSAPTVSFTGGTGSGAVAIAILNATGGLARIILKAEGSGYNGAETVVLTGGGGSGATAVVFVQSATCFLIEEKASAHAPDPYDSLCLLVTRTYETLPGPFLISTHLADDSVVVTTQRRRNLRSSITPGESVVAGVLTKITSEAITNSVSWEIKETRALPGNICTDYDQDPKTGALVTTNYRLVDSSTITDEGTIIAGRVLRYKHLDAFMSLRIESLYSTPPGRVEYRLGAFSFPNLLFSYSYTDACGAFVFQRARFSAVVLMKTIVSYGTSPSPPSNLLIIPNTFSFGRFNVSDVLNDSGSLVFTGTCALTATLPASTPSATGYLALTGTFQNIGGESVQVNGGLYENTQVQVNMM